MLNPSVYYGKASQHQQSWNRQGASSAASYIAPAQYEYLPSSYVASAPYPGAHPGAPLPSSVPQMVRLTNKVPASVPATSGQYQPTALSRRISAPIQSKYTGLSPFESTSSPGSVYSQQTGQSDNTPNGLSMPIPASTEVIAATSSHALPLPVYDSVNATTLPSTGDFSTGDLPNSGCDVEPVAIPYGNSVPALTLREPLLQTGNMHDGLVDLELGQDEKPACATLAPWKKQLTGWFRPMLFLLAGVAVWIWPERWFAVLLILMGLAFSPLLAPVIFGPLPSLPSAPLQDLKRWVAEQLKPDSELMVSVREWLVEFIGSLGTTVLEKKHVWKPKVDQALAPDSEVMTEVKRHVVAIVNQVVEEVIQQKPIWKPKLQAALSPNSELMQEVDRILLDFVGKLCKDVLLQRGYWMQPLVGTVGEVAPCILNEVMTRHRMWSPQLMAFLAEIVPPIVGNVLSSPQLPPAIARFLRQATPELTPAVVMLIAHVLADPNLSVAIKSMTDRTMQDRQMMEGIKAVIQENLSDGNMYRAAGHGVMHAGVNSLRHRADHVLEKLHLKQRPDEEEEN